MDKRKKKAKAQKYQFKSFKKNHFFPKGQGPGCSVPAYDPYVRDIAYRAKKLIQGNPKMFFRKRPRRQLFIAFNSTWMRFSDLQELAAIVTNQICANYQLEGSAAILHSLHANKELTLQFNWMNRCEYTSSGYLLDAIDCYACLALIYVDEAISMPVASREDSLHVYRLLSWAQRAIATGLSLTEKCSYEPYGNLAKDFGIRRRGKLQTLHAQERIRKAQQKFLDKQARDASDEKNKPNRMAKKWAWGLFKELRKEDPKIKATDASKLLLPKIQEFLKNFPRSENQKQVQLKDSNGAKTIERWIGELRKLEKKKNIRKQSKKVA